MNEARKKEEASHKQHVDNKVNTEKKGVDSTSKNDVVTHASTLTKKEIAEAKAHAKSIAANSKKVKKESDDAIKEEITMLKNIEKLEITAIKSQEAREIATLKFKTAEELKRVAASKVSELTKAAYVQALNAQLARDISATEKKHRDEKVAADKKAADEIEKDQETKRQFRQKVAFETEKAIIDNQLLNQRASNAEVLRLTLQRLEAEKKATINKLDTELAYDNKTLKEAYDAEVKKAKESGQNTTELHDKYTGDQKAIDTKYRAESALADTQYQTKKTQEQDEHNKKKHENNQKFFSGLLALIDGDFKSFTDGMSAKLGIDTKTLSARKQATIIENDGTI